MRKALTAIALSTLFAAAPAFASKHVVSKAPAKTVSADEATKPAEGEKKPASTKKKGTKKPKAEKTETPPAEAPAK